MSEQYFQRNLSDRLIQALQKDEFALYAQNIVSLGNDTGRSFQEIFVRFKEEDAKLMPPGDFFGVLKENHLLPYLDRWVVNCLARWVRNRLSIKPDWEVPRSNVNLSDQTLNDPQYPEYVRSYVEGPHLPDGAIAFEIGVESAFQHFDAFKRLTAAVNSRACSFTLAGFNGNERSIDMLRAFAPDFVKIDYACVANHQLPELVRMSRLLRTKSIVEFVETEQALDFARSAKADYVQGFGISPVHPL